ncbi:MAG TPA: hypothetical protein VHR15_06070 [Ktedonobacterales bacterium]|jgi:hypothetical protein|nr:hypothetical protein [Ktedonobacterales bacterium]
MRQTRHTRHTQQTLAGLFLLGALLGLAACGSTAYASQAATQPVKVLTPSGRGSTIRCDGKQAKEAYLFPTLTNVPFPALVEGVAHTTNTQGGASVEQWDACTSALTATGLRAFYNGGMPQSDWQISPAFPYQGATPSACANADLCWKRADGSVTVYIALQNVRDQNSAVYFTVRQVTVK